VSALLDAFERLGIRVDIAEHPAVYTVEQSKALRGELAAAHLKNLLLRNEKNELWLLCALEDTPVGALAALGMETRGSGRWIRSGASL
jgi:Ala-tRNA(Pro) deacylase